MRPTQKFVILSLPRSRTAWLANYLSSGPARVGHDVALWCDTVEQYVGEFERGMSGSVETGAQDAADLLLQLGVKLVVLQRPVEEVHRSLLAQGIDAREEMERRAKVLERVSAQPGVRTVQFADLESPFVCKWLQEYTTGEPFIPERWQHFSFTNIQIDMDARKGFLLQRESAMQQLKAQVAEMSSELPEPPDQTLVRQCGWAELWPECNRLGAAHYAEVEGELASQRPYLLNSDMMTAMEGIGALKLIGAWKRGRLVGYCSWLVQPDVESAGKVIAQQGAWYAERGSGVGLTLMRESLKMLRELGVHNVFPHHRLQGRGSNLGRLFRRLGAVPTQHTYMISLGA